MEWNAVTTRLLDWLAGLFVCCLVGGLFCRRKSAHGHVETPGDNGMTFRVAACVTHPSIHVCVSLSDWAAPRCQLTWMHAFVCVRAPPGEDRSGFSGPLGVDTAVCCACEMQTSHDIAHSSNQGRICLVWLKVAGTRTRPLQCWCGEARRITRAETRVMIQRSCTVSLHIQRYQG
jgi:hypothetical protein